MVDFFKPVRKMLLFGNGEHDQALWEAIEVELEKQQYKSFGDLCKTALHQFLLGRDPNQSVLLFIELEKQIASLQHRVLQLEEVGNATVLERLQSLESQLAQSEGKHQRAADNAFHPNPDQDPPTTEQERSPTDPLLARLGPLLEEF